MKIVFFTQNRWAFGSIHHGLCKELWKHGIFANLLDWDTGYSVDEMKAIADTYDVFVTQPDGVDSLNSYGIPYNRIIAIAHGQWDILFAKQNARHDWYPELRNFGVISKHLSDKCAEWGISVRPKIAELGLHCHLYDCPVSEKLSVVGYAGAFSSRNWKGEEIKRGHLAAEACKKAGLPLYEKSIWNHLAMPGYYKLVDAVIMSSMEEAGGLPMMECAASGRLPIGTPVGYFEHNAPNGGGILVPLDQNDFVTITECILHDYKMNPVFYRKKCEEVRDFAVKNYDWSVKIQNWINILCQ